MSVDTTQIKQWIKAMQSLEDDAENFMKKTVAQEAMYAVRQARKLARDKGKVNTGLYMRSFQSSKEGRKLGNKFIANFYNPLDYALHLEYGFRSHFVPGEWEGNTFVYYPLSDEGMYVGPKGGYIPGTFIFRLAIQRTEQTQAARVHRKINAWVRSKGL